MSNIQTEQKKVISFLSRFGCADVRQIYYTLGDLPHKDAKMVITSMIKNNSIEVVGDRYLVPAKSGKKVDKDTINCIWVMAHLSHHPTEMRDAFIAQHPAKIFFVADGNTSFELIPMSEGKTMGLRIIDEKYSAITAAANKRAEKASKTGKDNANRRRDISWPVFVTTNPSVVDIIKDYGLNCSFAVALVEYPDGASKPSITIKKRMQK